MKIAEITSCYLGPEISPEQFIQEHFFIYLLKGTMVGYDAHQKNTLKPGEYCLAHKNHLARYNKQKDEGQFEKVVVIFDEAFLKAFKEKHPLSVNPKASKEAFSRLNKSELVPNFVRSLNPYYNGEGKIDETFSNIKREELLLILLRTNPGLENILFEFGTPEKVDLEAFMNRNYKFNVSVERFAYLTGRSLSSFKRDFESIFKSTPSHWLVQKRLEEAHFLIATKEKKPSDIYLELGFEDLSHFSFAFKKRFGQAPTEFFGKPVTGL